MFVARCVLSVVCWLFFVRRLPFVVVVVYHIMFVIACLVCVVC